MISAWTDQWLRVAADRFGTPAFVYFTDLIAERIDQIDAAFGGRFALSFAVKSNPNPALLGWLRGRIDHLDISSIGEMRLAMQAGWDAARMSFTGPGKRAFEIEEAVRAGIGNLVVESLREARLADAIARGESRVQPIVVRIAPASVPKGFGDQMAGRPSAFGIDIEDAEPALAEMLALPGLRLTGLHVYSGTQCLKPEPIVENYRGFLTIFRDLCGRFDLTPETLIFGSGLGVPYHDQDVPLDLGAVAAGIIPELDAFRGETRFGDAVPMLELGRYLVAEAGYFLTRVISIKESRGSRIAICDGGMNNHLPASGHFGMVIRRNYSMHKLGGGEPAGKVDIVGPLCTSIDRLASGIELPEIAEGDIIAVHNSGAYGLTASPIHFISHAPPVELLVSGNAISDISRDLNALPPPADAADAARRRA